MPRPSSGERGARRGLCNGSTKGCARPVFRAGVGIYFWGALGRGLCELVGPVIVLQRGPS